MHFSCLTPRATRDELAKLYKSHDFILKKIDLIIMYIIRIILKLVLKVILKICTSSEILNVKY